MKNKSKSLVVHLSIIATIILVFFISLHFVILPKITSKNPLITVPRLVGLSLEEAIKVLQSSKLRYSFEDSPSFNKNVSEGIIVSQSVSPNESIKQNRIILLTINKKNNVLVTVPDLRNETIRNAIVVMENLQLKLGKLVYINDIACNLVLEQTTEEGPILPGTKVREGTEINLTIGVKNINDLTQVPLLKGLDASLVEEKLLDKNLNLANIIYQEDGEVEAGAILKSYPAEEEFVPVGSSVVIYIKK